MARSEAREGGSLSLIQSLGRPIYKKVVLQAAYHANVLAVHSAPGICQRWMDKHNRRMFPQWGMSPVILELKDEAAYKKFYIAAKSAGAEWENLLAAEVKQELQLAANFLGELAEAVGELQVARMGLRFYYLLPVPDFDELRRLLLERCTRWADFAGAFGAQDADVGISWQFDAGDANIHITVGPVKREEFGKFFESVDVGRCAREDRERFFPSAALLFDGDFSQREEPLRNMRRFILRGEEFLESKFVGFQEALGIQAKE